jgi:pyruvate ferredoxin oxidoreductase alpha subunit
MVESGELVAEYMHVESEHSALSATMGGRSVGAEPLLHFVAGFTLYGRSQHYASGGRTYCNDEC